MIRPSSTSAARVSPMPASYIHSAKRHPDAGQQRTRFEQRQADDVRMAAGQETHEHFGAPLDGIAARLAHPLAALDIPADPGLGQPLEGDTKNGRASCRERVCQYV